MSNEAIDRVQHEIDIHVKVYGEDQFSKDLQEIVNLATATERLRTQLKEAEDRVRELEKPLKLDPNML